MSGMAPQPSVLVPLYIYPAPGAWDPVYQVALEHPSLDFTVVVNPHSGPGIPSLPDANYTREIPRLNEFDNIRTLGYVATDYGRKGLDATLAEITKYAAWSTQDAALSLDGIFFDETPTHYEQALDAYLHTISSAVQETVGLAEGFVVHNPGYIPDERYLAHADLTVVFEQTYDTWVNMTTSRKLEELNYDRSNLVTLMHSLPELPDHSIRCLIDHLRLLTGNIFLTSLSAGYYQNWSPHFTRYVGLMA